MIKINDLELGNAFIRFPAEKSKSDLFMYKKSQITEKEIWNRIKEHYDNFFNIMKCYRYIHNYIIIVDETINCADTIKDKKVVVLLKWKNNVSVNLSIIMFELFFDKNDKCCIKQKEIIE